MRLSYPGEGACFVDEVILLVDMAKKADPVEFSEDIAIRRDRLRVDVRKWMAGSFVLRNTATRLKLP